MDERNIHKVLNGLGSLIYRLRKSMIPGREVVMKQDKLFEGTKMALMALDEIYSRLGSETLFCFNKDFFFIAKNQELIIGNKRRILKFDSEEIKSSKKAYKAIGKFGLTYRSLKKTEIVSCSSFKEAVYKAGFWLGLPL